MRLDEALSLLAEGKRSYIFLAAVERDVAIALGVEHTRDVKLSRESYAHIKSVHPEITYREFKLLPDAIRKGLVIREGGSPRKAAICYQSPESDQRYMAALHGTAKGDDIYCTTFHRARKGNTKSKIERGEIIRRQK